MKKLLTFGTVVLAVAAVAGLVSVTGEKRSALSGDASSPRADSDVRYGPGPIDLQTEGPLMDGQVTTVDQAMQATGYIPFPVPPTNDLTGPLTNIWIDGLKQVAFVWQTDLRFYINPLLGTTEGELIARWAPILPEVRSAALTTVANKVALGIEGTSADEPTSLTWADPESGLFFQYVSPIHTVDQLKAMVEAFTSRSAP